MISIDIRFMAFVEDNETDIYFVVVVFYFMCMA